MFGNITIRCLKIVLNQFLWKMTQTPMKSHYIREVIQGRQLQSMFLWIANCCGNTCTCSQYNNMTTSRQFSIFDIHTISFFFICTKVIHFSLFNFNLNLNTAATIPDNLWGNFIDNSFGN